MADGSDHRIIEIERILRGVDGRPGLIETVRRNTAELSRLERVDAEGGRRLEKMLREYRAEVDDRLKLVEAGQARIERGIEATNNKIAGARIVLTVFGAILTLGGGVAAINFASVLGSILKAVNGGSP